MVRTREQDITLREGTGKKYWYTIMGYVVALPLVMVYLAVTMNEAGAMATAMSAGIFILLLLFLGLASIPALFKDAAYLRETRSRWTPEWWKYNGAAFGAPVVTYFGIDVAGLGDAGPMAMLVFVVVSYGTSAYYIFNRHRYIGVP